MHGGDATAQTRHQNPPSSAAAVLRQVAAAASAVAAAPASRRSVAAVLSAAAAAAPATAAAHDDDAQSCSRRIRCCRHDPTAIDSTVHRSATVPRRPRRCSLARNHSFQQQVEHAAVSPTISSHVYHTRKRSQLWCN